MTIEELRDEYRTHRIGSLIYGEVERTADMLTGKYDPRIYGGVADWRDGREDLIQGIVTDLLLAEGQLDYIMAQATALDDFRALLFYQARRYLARSRQRTVIDNLLDRAEEILRQGPFEEVTAQPRTYQLHGAGYESRPPTEIEIRASARLAIIVPWVPPGSSERAPIVYRRENLKKLLVIVAERLPCTFSKQDLHKILELLLTDWVPSFLEEIEEDQSRSEELTPEDEVQVIEAQERILNDLGSDERVILRAQLLKTPDSIVAEELGTSRQTVIARRQRLFNKLQPVLADLPERTQRAVLGGVGLALAASTGEV